MKLTKFTKYTWGLLFYNVTVVLWGAYERATGSGAGCGSHWPLCNGEVIPRAQQAETLAVLVLFVWVAQDASIGRVISIAVHLVNTFLLLASITLTAWWSSGGKAVRLKGGGGKVWVLVVGLVGVFFIGITGAITALGDTLYPSTSLVKGLWQDFSGTGHILLRLRIWHPVIAVLVAFYIGFIALWEWSSSSDLWVRKFSALLGGFLSSS
jgi:hypothetical protein